MKHELICLDKGNNSYLLRLSGTCLLLDNEVSIDSVITELTTLKSLSQLSLDMTGISQWDMRLVTLIYNLRNYCSAKGIKFSYDALPDGVIKLLTLSTTAVTEPVSQSSESGNKTQLIAIIKKYISPLFLKVKNILSFIGLVIQSMGRFITGRAQYRRQDLILLLQKAGVEALPIISLISLLIGLIIAFVGAVQLTLFSAEIYTANIVGLAMVREMGCMMTGVIVTGRTGASYAAEIGAMQSNEEIDAYKTMGIDPIDFLVLPRVLALVLMMPLLCIYSDIVGIIGGYLTGLKMFNFSWIEYFTQTKSSIKVTDVYVGISKSVFFGFIIAVTGCLYGINSGRSSIAVGKATTGAVVSGIVSIIIVDSIFTIIFQRLGI